MSKLETLLADELSCPICLQFYSDPVVLPCGHNYCLDCIRKHSLGSGAGGDGGPPRCPECREEYGGADDLLRNFKLCSIVAGYRARETEEGRGGPVATAPPPPSEPPALETGLSCDHCPDGSSMAVKTCLICEVSLCGVHLRMHGKRKTFGDHALVDSPAGAGPRGCALHGRPLEYFCSSDMATLCAACLVQGLHQNHDVLTFDVAEEEMRRALENRSRVVSCRLQMTDGLLQKVSEDKGSTEAVGDKLVSRAVTIMTSMAGLVDRYRQTMAALLEEERGQRRASWQSGVVLLEEQQQQLQEAQSSAAQALGETDQSRFIRSFLLLEPRLREAACGSLAWVPARDPLNTKRLQAGLRTQDFRAEMTRLLESLHLLLNPLELTFNPCTAHPSLLLSKDLRTVRYCAGKQPYPEHAERFVTAPQVLCAQGFSSGEHLWVVEVGGASMWSVGLCYKAVARRGDPSRLGHNSVSWRLQWKNGKLTACHASANVALPEKAGGGQPTRLEVALDYEGGTLAFHGTKGRREHLYTFRAAFREKVFPAFSIHSTSPESWITLQSGL